MKEHSPFHKGELAIQERLGVKDMVGSYAPRVIREFMPDQHREFFGSLRYFLMGSVDAGGAVWASMLWGAPGFVASPDARTLNFDAMPDSGDPLHGNLRDGAEIGMVGIEFHTRRRNRVNGRVTKIYDRGFSLEITQSFGNCPQYIQGREITELRGRENLSQTVTTAEHLSQHDEAQIARADTLFIASASASLGSDARHGVDMSHRGGTPGFVKVLDDGALLIPDFSGNNHFNTLGNIAENPVAGLLFSDFTSGDILQLSGTAEIVWPDESLFHYEGALRYLRIMPNQVVRRAGALPYAWDTADMSPFLPKSEWQPVKAARPATVNEEMELTVADIVDEANGIKSFYLKPESGQALATYKPGQHLPIAVTAGHDKLRRTYTLSSRPAEAALRLTVKRDAKGTVSRFMHDSVAVGSKLTVRAPAGNFILQKQRARPVVLLSAGVGITPMIAMAETLLFEGKNAPEIHFIHGSRSPADMPFLGDLRRWTQSHANFSLSLRFSETASAEVNGLAGRTHGFDNGRIDANYLNNIDIPKGADYYLCGPGGFMQSIYDHLIASDILDSHIFFEAFGPSSLTRKSSEPKKLYPPQTVKFSRSGTETSWNASEVTLLETAENSGIDAPYSCRSGSCGSCMVPLLEGRAAYETPPAYPVDDDHILLCCAVPAPPKKGKKTAPPLVIDI